MWYFSFQTDLRLLFDFSHNHDEIFFVEYWTLLVNAF